MLTTLSTHAKNIIRSINDHEIETRVLRAMVCRYASMDISFKAIIEQLAVMKIDVSKAVERLRNAFPEYNIQEMLLIEKELENAVFVVEQDYLPLDEDSGFVLV